MEQQHSNYEQHAKCVQIQCQPIIIGMSWYNTFSDTTRRLQALIDTQPSLQALLEFPQLLEMLKAYQPKLLEYITNSPDIPKQLVELLTKQPKEGDSQQRKYRWPMMALLMVESNTTCVVNCFFRIDPQTKRTYFIQAFYQLLGGNEQTGANKQGQGSQELQAGRQQLLPLLCGYFAQWNGVLWNNRYKQAIDLIYQDKQPFYLLAKHSYSKAIINTLLLYLNLDQTRNAALLPERTSLKLNIVNLLLDQVRVAFQAHQANQQPQLQEIIVENISQVLIQIVEKYYLIADGKTMLDIILRADNIKLILDMLMGSPSESKQQATTKEAQGMANTKEDTQNKAINKESQGMALAISGVVGWLMRYYCLSSFNIEDFQNMQVNRKNQERLQAQPFIKLVLQLLPQVVSILSRAQSLTLYHSRLLQIFNMALELSSPQLAGVVLKTKYIQMLVGLVFKFPTLSIVHKMVQKVFQQIFNSDRAVYEHYKRYLFVEGGLIQLTVGQYLTAHPDLAYFKDNISKLHQGYFGHLMKVIKIYSKVQTNDDAINDAIMKRSQVWDKFSNFILRPYQALCFKDLGSYEQTKAVIPTEYIIKNYFTAIQQTVSRKVLDQINHEESIQQLKQHQENTQEIVPHEDGLFALPALSSQSQNNQNSLSHHNTDKQREIPKQQENTGQKATRQLIIAEAAKQQIKSSLQSTAENRGVTSPRAGQENSYRNFIRDKKIQVDVQIQNARSSSREKRLSANKSRVTSPSPKKNKKWDDSPAQQPQKLTQKTPTVKPTQTDRTNKMIQSEKGTRTEPQNSKASRSTELQNNKKQKISLTQMGRPPIVSGNKTPRPGEALYHKADAVNDQTNQRLIDTAMTKGLGVGTPQQQTASSQQDVVSSLNLAGSMEVSEQMVRSSVSEIKQKTSALGQAGALSRSAVFSSELRNIQFRRQPAKVEGPKVCRKIGQKDHALLQFLGVKF